MLGGESFIDLHTIEIITPIALTNMQIAVTSTCKPGTKRKYSQLFGELINDANIGHLRNHVIFSNHVIGALSE